MFFYMLNFKLITVPPPINPHTRIPRGLESFHATNTSLIVLRRPENHIRNKKIKYEHIYAYV